MKHLVLMSLSLVSVLLATRAHAIDLPPDARVTPIHPHAWQFQIIRPDQPIAIYGVVIDRDATGLKLVTTANADSARGRSTVDVQANALANANQVPVAAVNGDFFVMTGTFAGTTTGGMIVNDELFRFADARPVFATLDDTLAPFIGPIDIDANIKLPDATVLDVPLFNRPFEINAETKERLALFSPRWGKSTDTKPGTLEVLLKFHGSLEENATVNASVVANSTLGNSPLIGGTLVLAVHPELAQTFKALKPGETVAITTTSKGQPPLDQMIAGAPVLVKESKIAIEPDKDVHPRTAIAFDEKHIVLLAVDGRAPGHSKGMTLFELASFLHSIGATDALNLDGGGSTTLWVRGNTINRPSDGMLRANPNGLALVTTQGVGTPSHIRINHILPIRMTPGATVVLNPQLTDSQLNPIDGQSVTLNIDPEVGELDRKTFTAKRVGSHVIRATAGEISTTFDVEVVESPHQITVDPQQLRVLPESRHVLEIQGLTEKGQVVMLDQAQVTIRIEPQIARMAGSTFVAGDVGGQAMLTLTGYGKTVQVPVSIASHVGLENVSQDTVTFRGFPETVKGKLEVSDGAAALWWDFTGITSTAAAYATIDRDISDAMAIKVQLQAGGKSFGSRAMVKAAVVDGNGTRHLYNLFDGKLPGDWTQCSVELPVGLKHPVKWQSVYVVSTDANQFAPVGQILIRDWAVMR
jgi:Phosphodiester glycosidase